MNATVELERRGGIALVTVSNPTIKNALTRQMALDLVGLFDEVDNDPSLGCLIVTGADGAFCSGADTKSWSEAFAEPDTDRSLEEADAMYNAFFRLGQVGMPTIAAVNGAAVGAGLNLAMATDLRIVAKDVRLMAGFLRAGIHPGGGFFTMSSRLAGREAAAAMGLFSEEVSGERAVEIGLAWEAVEPDAVLSRSLELAARITQDIPLARRAVRSFRLETEGASMPWAVALEVERGVQAWSQTRRLRAPEMETN